MSLRTLTLLLAVFIASCSGDHVAISLDQVAIRTVDHSKIFAEQMYPGADNGPPRQVVQLTISSQTELIKHFTDGGKQLQVRCSVNGATNGKEYYDPAFGPFPEASSSDSRHRYNIYAYVDLEADSAELENGKPASRMDLKNEHFDSLSCQLVGVEMASWLFLRSNDLVIPVSTFHALLHALPQQVTPNNSFKPNPLRSYKIPPGSSGGSA